MNTVNVHEAKTQLSRPTDRGAQDEPFVIAKAGKQLVKVSAVGAAAEPKRLGFLKSEIEVLDDVNRINEREIAALFGIGA